MQMPPAARVMTRASSKNCERMCAFLAPSARRRPISRTRSSTETSMMFMTPTPPMPSVMAPMKKRSASMPMVMPSMMGLNSSLPNMVMARLSFAETFVPPPSDEKDHAPAFSDVLGGNPPAVHGNFVTHVAVFGINAADGGVREPLFMTDALGAHRLAGHALDQRRLRFHPFRVFRFKSNWFSGAFTD